MTKKEYREYKAAWNKALAEGRVLRFNGGESFKSYPTVEMCQEAYRSYLADGVQVNVVVPCVHDPVL